MKKRGSRAAFSLVELMVVIGIIGILIAIILPALGGARGASRRTKSLANLRSLSQIVEMYTQRYDDMYPWGQRGVNTCGVPMWFDPIWELRVQWPIVLHGEMTRGELRSVMLSPGAIRDGGSGPSPCAEPTSYYYSQSFLASPETWSGSASADPKLLGGVRTGRVAFPAQKVLMWEWELPYLNRAVRKAGEDISEPVPMAFVDGHVAQHAPAAATDPVANPFPRSSTPTARLHNTRGGVRGVDY